MNQDFISNWNVQLKKGVLTYMVLSVISKKNCFGGEIISIIHENTGILLADGTLYPLLKKLKEEHCILSKWVIDDKDDKARKYYYLTGKGNGILKEMSEHWKSLNLSIAKLTD